MDIATTLKPWVMSGRILAAVLLSAGAGVGVVVAGGLGRGTTVRALTIASCPASSLSLTGQPGGLDMSGTYTIYTITNTASDACSISGAPVLAQRLASGTGAVQQITEDQPFPAGAEVDLAPGGVGSFSVEWLTCTSWSAPGTTVDEVNRTWDLGGGTGAVAGPQEQFELGCDNPTANVSPVQAGVMRYPAGVQDPTLGSPHHPPGSQTRARARWHAFLRRDVKLTNRREASRAARAAYGRIFLGK